MIVVKLFYINNISKMISYVNRIFVFFFLSKSLLFEIYSMSIDFWLELTYFITYKTHPKLTFFILSSFYND